MNEEIILKEIARVTRMLREAVRNENLKKSDIYDYVMFDIIKELERYIEIRVIKN